jgi:type I restriction enzyme R subunit
VKNRDDREQYRQVLMPRFAANPFSPGSESCDTRQMVRDDFQEALTRFGLCLQTALSSRSFFEDHAFSEQTLQTYKDDLRFFTELRRIAQQDAQETVRHGTYADQMRSMVDRQVVGVEVREPEGVYRVHKTGVPEEPRDWSAEKTRNETDLIRTRLTKTIEQDLADDPYAQQVFAALLKQTIAQAEAMFEHPVRQYAVFRAFETQVAARTMDGMPDAFDDHPHARAYFGICRLVLGKEGFAAAGMDDLVKQAFFIDAAVEHAVAEHSLNPQNIETSIRQVLLPALFASMGLERAKDAIAQVVQVVRVRLDRERR